MKNDLSEVSLADLKGKRVVLNVFPSVDTPTCATSVRTFNARAAEAPNTVVLCVSADLPFATKRFSRSDDVRALRGVEQGELASRRRSLRSQLDGAGLDERLTGKRYAVLWADSFSETLDSRGARAEIEQFCREIDQAIDVLHDASARLEAALAERAGRAAFG